MIQDSLKRRAEDVRLYFETTRHLKPVQVYGLLRAKLIRPNAFVREPIALRVPTGRWTDYRTHSQSQTGPRRFRFLNIEANLEPGEWDPVRLPKLWRYMLHYFDDLNAQDADQRTSWHINSIDDWISANTVGAGTGWEPYPTCLRLMNWIKWLLRGNEPVSGMLASLVVQAEYLSGSFEYRLLGNHLLANACGLLFAGMFFEGQRAQRWFCKAVRLLDQELAEQILADGAHFELSPMYQATILEDLLDAVNATTVYPALFEEGTSDRWRAYAVRMAKWLEMMCHPDGEISFFNDCAFEIAPTLSHIRQYCTALGIHLAESAAEAEGIHHFTDSGFIKINRSGATLFFDVGQIGPNYQPGHGHADTLSFELSYCGTRVFVNSGTSTYESGELRDFQRGTAAHNTLVVDRHDQSELWGAFRVARRAQPASVTVELNGSVWQVCAVHDGYRRLTPPLFHRRTILSEVNSFRLVDHLDGEGTHEIDIYLHLHPEVRIKTNGSGFLITLKSEHRLFLQPDNKLTSVVESSLWYPRFGDSESSRLIHMRWTGQCPVTFETAIHLQIS
jgi:uncharacterized heparinase superfamily protein